MTRTRLLMMLVAGMVTAAFISIGCGGSGYLSEFPTEVGDGAIVHIESEAGTPYGYSVAKGYARDPVEGQTTYFNVKGIQNGVGSTCEFNSFTLVDVTDGEIKASVGECIDSAHCLILTTSAGNPCSYTLIGQLRPEKLGANPRVMYAINFIALMETDQESNVGSISFIISDDDVADPSRLNVYKLDSVTGPTSLTACDGGDSTFAYVDDGDELFQGIFDDISSEDRLQQSLFITTVGNIPPPPPQEILPYCEIGWSAPANISLNALKTGGEVIYQNLKVDFNAQICDSRNATACDIAGFSASVP